MKKVLFLEKNLRMDKLGVCYLSAVLKRAGHEVDLMQDDYDDVDGYLSANPVDFVMYSVTSEMAEWVAKRNRELKDKYRFLSVVGGPHPTFMPLWGTQDPAIDYVVQGPGESVILSIVDGLAQRLSRGKLLGQFEYFFPDRSILYKYEELGKARMKRFIACRYCLFSCTHCFNHAFKKMYLDQRSSFTYRPSPETMIQEIMAVKDEYGLELAYLNDDDLADNPNWIEKFCDLLINTGAQIGFCGSIRADSVDEKKVELMARAGCKLLNISIESANVETQKLLRRGRVTNNDVYMATRWCEEAGIKVRLQNMIGLPVEDPLADALETFELNKKCRPTESVVTIYQPLPGTELYAYCVEKGFISNGAQPTSYNDKTILKIKDAEEINRLDKHWYWAVKENWPIELLKERLNNPISDEMKETMTQARRAASKKEFYKL